MNKNLSRKKQMRKMFLALILSMPMFFSCLSGSSSCFIALNGDGVQLFDTMPEGAKTIAFVRATGSAFNMQESVDLAEERLKKQVEALGADGVVLDAWEHIEQKSIKGVYIAILQGRAVVMTGETSDEPR